MIASRFKPSRTPQIVIHLCRVRITIYFYGKPFASRSKVNDEIPDQDLAGEFDAGDRKSVVSGKSVSVRVDLGGRRILKEKRVLNRVTVRRVSMEKKSETCCVIVY